MGGCHGCLYALLTGSGSRLVARPEIAAHFSTHHPQAHLPACTSIFSYSNCDLNGEEGYNRVETNKMLSRCFNLQSDVCVCQCRRTLMLKYENVRFVLSEPP